MPDPDVAAALRKRAYFDALAAALARDGADWRAIPGLESRNASFDRRFASVSAGRRAAVPYPRLLRRFLQARFPTLAQGGKGDPTWIDLPVAPDTVLSIAITKIHHWGLGKAFTLGIDLVPAGRKAERVLFDNLFLLFGTRDEPCWTYQTSDDLAACFAAMGDLMDRVLSIAAGEAARVLTRSATELWGTLEERPDCTARAAHAVALPVATARVTAPKLVGVINQGWFLGSRQEPAIDRQGRLAAHGSWQLHFRDPRNPVVWVVEVPALGAVRCSELTLPPSAVGTGFGPAWRPVVEDWVDSSRAMSAADEAAGDQLRAAPLPPFFISCRLGSQVLGDGSGPWTVHYCGLELVPRRRDLLVTVDPQTGQVASVSWH